MKNGLLYLSKESGHPWPELREIHEQVQKARPQIYAVQDVVLTSTPPVEFGYISKSANFKPQHVRQEITRLFEEINQDQILTDGDCLAQPSDLKSLTLGLQTGRISDTGCVIKRTLEWKHEQLIQLVHQLAQAVVGQALPYLGFRILKLEHGQVLNQHRG